MKQPRKNRCFRASTCASSVNIATLLPVLSAQTAMKRAAVRMYDCTVFARRTPVARSVSMYSQPANTETPNFALVIVSRERPLPSLWPSMPRVILPVARCSVSSAISTASACTSSISGPAIRFRNSVPPRCFSKLGRITFRNWRK